MGGSVGGKFVTKGLRFIMDPHENPTRFSIPFPDKINSYDITRVGPALQTFSLDGNKTFTSYFQFNGTSDYMWIDTLNYGSGVQISEFSVFAWMRTTFNSGTPGVWNNNNWSILDFDRSEVFTFTVNGTGEVQIAGRPTSAGGFSTYIDSVGSARNNDGNWHYIGYTFSVANQRIQYFVDGKLDRTQNANGSLGPLGAGSTTYGIIGDGSEARTPNSSRNNIYFQGDIGAIHMWDAHALTEAEVYTNFNATRSRFGL